jgi:hypothetical protein
MSVDAVDACNAFIPPMEGFWVAFRENFFNNPGTCKTFDFNMCEMGPRVNVNNVGHIVLAMRNLTGDDVCRAHSAYLKALGKCTVRPSSGTDDDVVMDPKRLLWYHASVCRILGSCHYAPPTSVSMRTTTLPQLPTTTPEAAIVILFEILERAAPEFLLSSKANLPADDRKEMFRVMSSWHCPKYVRDVDPAEARYWNLDRPRERTAAFMKYFMKQVSSSSSISQK